MSGVNKVILVGHLGRDPEVGTTHYDTPAAGFPLATSRQWKDKHGQRQEKTEWHRVVALGKQAELCAEHAKKGDRLYIEGELNYRDYEHNGSKRQVCEVRVLRMEFLTARKTDTPSHSAAGAKAVAGHATQAPSTSKNQTQQWAGEDFPGEEVPF